MKIKVIAEGKRFTLPIPSAMVGLAARCIPNRAIVEIQSSMPEPYRELVTKRNVRMLLKECAAILKENKGLEIIHVEAANGDFVSIKL